MCRKFLAGVRTIWFKSEGAFTLRELASALSEETSYVFEESDVGVPFRFRHMLLPVFEGGFEDCN